VALWTTGRRNEARVSLRECLEIDPDYLPALKIFAQDLAQRKEPERALPMLESWVRQEPDNAEALYNLGACALMLDRYELGRQSLRRFLEVAPDDERAASVRQSLAEMN
jgi:tetratricopeptide (TPR) repeat protein